MRSFIAAASLAAAATMPAMAQLVPEGQRPALDILRAEEVPVNILGDMSEGCRIDGQGVFDVVLGSLDHYEINWIRGEDHHDWRILVTLNLFGEGGEAGCAGNLLVEIYHAASIPLEFSSDTFENDAILLRLENRFGPTFGEGDALQEEFLNWLAAELGSGWAMMLEEQG
jgi:hypothetical protein